MLFKINSCEGDTTIPEEGPEGWWNSSVSSFVMMRSLVCPIVPPPPSSFPLSCLQHNYCVYPVSDCTLSSCFTTLPTASRVSSHENCRALDLPDFEVFRVNSGHLISYSDILSKP